MSAMENQAAWQITPGLPLEIKTAPYPSLKSNQIVVRSRAVAVNPVDRMLGEAGTRLFSWVKFPFILGSDVAGDILEVGKDVQILKPGDRVVAMAMGFTHTSSDPAQGAFQHCVLVREDMCALIPDNTSYEQACVIPLGLSTAACGLYMKDYLALELPRAKAKSTGKTVLIWGGSTSVGINAIQLASSSGYEVITTCSPKNFELVKMYGAAQAYDYNSPTVVSDIVKAFDGKVSAGALSIGDGALEKCLEIMATVKDGKRFVAMASFIISMAAPPKGISQTISTILRLLFATVRVQLQCLRHGMKTKFIFGSDLEENEVGPAVWKNYLGDALANGSFVPGPEPLIVPTKGLEGIQEGFELQKKGYNAKKVVISL